MLLEGTTNVCLLQSWHAGRLIRAKKAIFPNLLKTIVPAIVIVFVYAFLRQYEVLMLVTCLILGFISVSGLILIVYMMLIIWDFKRDSYKLFEIMGAKIKTITTLDKFKEYAFHSLVKAAEICLWTQTYKPSKPGLIALEQEKLRYLYDLFKKFDLLHKLCEESGYEVYFDHAKAKSKLPDWKFKMDPEYSKRSS